MTDHITVEDWLDQPTETARAHVGTCVECRALSDDLDAVRVAARALPADGWAGALPLELDVEGALAEVLAAATPQRRAPAILRFASSLAAATLLFSSAAPSLMQWRLEASPTTAHASQALAPTPSSIFWTTTSSPTTSSP
jgi:hypothetical protein